MAVCRFSAETFIVAHSYPRRFGNPEVSTCKGDLIPFNDCNEDIPKEKRSEKSVILVRCGHTRYHHKKNWYICTEHRKMFGKGFINELRQKTKCIYPECLNDVSGRNYVTYDQAKAYVEKGKKIIPYGAKVCVTCSIKMKDYLRSHEAEDAAANMLAATNSVENMDIEEEAQGPEKKKPRTDMNRVDSKATAGSDKGSLYTPSAASLEPSPENAGPTLNTEVPSTSSEEKEEKVKDILLKLIHIVDPEFTKTKCMGQTSTPLHKLHPTTHFKIRQTGAKAIDALISAMTTLPSNKRGIWKMLKESGCVERQLGFKDFLDSHLREIIKGYNMAGNSDERLEMVSHVAKIPMRRLGQFNPDPPKNPKEHGDNSDHQPAGGENNGDNGSINNLDGTVKRSVLHWNPPLTVGFLRKSKVHRHASKAAGQRVKRKKRIRERINREALEFINEVVTSEEQQQGVAHGTLLMKGVDGERVRVARAIRFRHQASLAKLLKALLKENNLQVLQLSTLKKILRMLPAGNAKDIQGLDPKYEHHRRAFVTLQEICTELLEKFTSKGAPDKVDMVEKVQQGLATSANYILGHFVYNLSEDSKCLNHCVNYACSEEKNEKQQKGTCFKNEANLPNQHPEECDHCNLFPAAFAELKNLFEDAKDCFDDLEIKRKTKAMDDGSVCIVSYKKQVFRHWVSSKKWDSYFREKNPKKVRVTCDFAMKELLRKAHETQPEWFGKRGTSLHGVAYERMVKTDEGWIIMVEVHIQILENDTLQDSDSVVALFLASLAQYKSAHMEVEEVIFSSDNAACYHCEDTVVRLWSQRKAIAGVTILGLHFGEPGKGKYICDQYFAILKALMRRFRAAGNDVDTPRKFAESLGYDGGAVNTVITLGDIEGRRDEKEKKGKKFLKDISKYYGFEFKDDGILATYLPGFGEGEFFKLGKTVKDNVIIPTFNPEIINRNDLDENLCPRYKTLPYMEEGQIVNDLKGCQGDVASAVPMETSNAEEDSDDEEFWHKKKPLVSKCKKNSLCIKTFLRPGDCVKHSNNPSDLCIVPVAKTSSMDQAKVMYISKNGISQKYQGKTFQQTRKMIFHGEMLPAVDPHFLNSGHKEELKPGHALPPARVSHRFSKEQKDFMINRFNRGVGNQKHLRKMAKLVELEMHKSGFEVEEWLSEKQITSYWGKLAADQRKTLIAKEKGLVNDESVPASDDLVEDTLQLLHAAQNEEAVNELEAKMDLENLETDDEDSPHPIEVGELENSLCDLAKDALESEEIEESMLFEYDEETLMNALKAVGVNLEENSTKEELCNAIVKHVQKKCECLLFQNEED